MTIAKWNVFEGELVSQVDRSDGNPFQEVDVKVIFETPSGFESVIDAFWDGGQVWRFRFCPTEVGLWKWRSGCNDEADTGLHGCSGEFECVEYEGENTLYRHGAVGVSDDGRHLVHNDGTSFFWLADTGWNVALKGTPDQWEQYLTLRRDQGFTAIQFVTTNWRAYNARQSYDGERNIKINVDMFRSLDGFFAACNEHGLLAVGVLLWTYSYPDPGQALWDEDAARLVRYQVARWGAFQTAWFLGGDGNYLHGAADRWKRIGRAVFAERADQLVTMHPGGQMWPISHFADEPWYDFIGYQSGHGDSEEHVKWLTAGPMCGEGDEGIVRPVINLEPNYENHRSYHTKHTFSSYHIRRAACWSLLVSPTAGVSYGDNWIWCWNDQVAPPEGHEYLGDIQPWQEGLKSEGAKQMGVIRGIFERYDWEKLRPCPEILIEQPGDDDFERFIAAARTVDGDAVFAYTPRGDDVVLKADALPGDVRQGRWFDPRNGVDQQAAGEVDGDSVVFMAPGNEDWLLVVG